MDVSEVEARAVDPPSEHNRRIIGQYLETDGRQVDHSMADSLILLYVTGRASGEIRRVPLATFPDGDALLVAASAGGSATNPQWYHNLVANPRVWVRRGDRVYEAEARPLTGDERLQRWERVVAAHPVFGGYQERSGRQIPLVRITER
jgi:deazaflavin-dependent oxidoreductase (nitroreductase family)